MYITPVIGKLARYYTWIGTALRTLLYHFRVRDAIACQRSSACPKQHPTSILSVKRVALTLFLLRRSHKGIVGAWLRGYLLYIISNERVPFTLQPLASCPNSRYLELNRGFARRCGRPYCHKSRCDGQYSE